MLQNEIKNLRNEVANAFIAGQKSKELSDLKEKYDGLCKEKTDMENEFTSIKSDYSHCLSQLSSKNKELSEYKAKCEKYEKTISTYSQLSANTISQEDYDKLKEQLNNKISEIVSLETNIQILQSSNKNTETLINLQKEEITSLKNTLREFTTFKYDEYDETYEAVLKAEFDRMKAAYENRIATMQSEIERIRKESFYQISEKTKENQNLTDTVERLTRRIKILK